MALHNLKIVVVDGGRSYSNNSKKTSAESDESSKKNYKDTPLYKLLNAKQTIKNKLNKGMSPAGVMTLNMGFHIASQIAKQTAAYYVNDIGRRNGDNNYQQIVNRQIEIASDITQLINGTLSGAATGSMFGGTVVGAVAGFTGSAISLGFKYADRQRTYRHELFKENTSQVYNLSRANYSIYSGRLR